MSLYRWAVRPALFAVAPEASHRLTLAACERLGRFAPIRDAVARHSGSPDPRLRLDVAGLTFASPVGLAAGFDKTAQAQQITTRLGFGFIEIGSVSLHPSPGNPGRPRLWRLPRDQALRIHYGCPSDGVPVTAARLRAQKLPVPLWINLVETNTGVLATADAAAAELAAGLAQIADIADLVVLNLSCPNMPRGGGGLFDDPADLRRLVLRLAAHSRVPPILLKISPPGAPNDPKVIEAILTAVEGVAAIKGFTLNIPLADPQSALRTPASLLASTRGGITGPALLTPTLAALQAWHTRINPNHHILVGVGGITRAEDAYAMISAGASLVQLYTALVYQGPGLVRRINEGLCHLLERDGLGAIKDAIGAGTSA